MWICGGYRLATGVRHPLTSVLPGVVVITAAEARGTGTPRATLTRRFAALTGQSTEPISDS